MPDKPKYGGPDRRQRYRVTGDVKVLVQVGSKFSQVGTVRNLTRTGIFFEAFGDYQQGMGVQVVFPYDPSKPSMDRPQHAEVIRVQEIEGSMKKGVAVKLLSIFLKP